MFHVAVDDSSGLRDSDTTAFVSNLCLHLINGRPHPSFLLIVGIPCIYITQVSVLNLTLSAIIMFLLFLPFSLPHYLDMFFALVNLFMHLMIYI